MRNHGRIDFEVSSSILLVFLIPHARTRLRELFLKNERSDVSKNTKGVMQPPTLLDNVKCLSSFRSLESSGSLSTLLQTMGILGGEG